MMRSFSFDSAFPNFAFPSLPGDPKGPVPGRTWTARLVVVRKGAHALPHVHNHWVEAHLIMSGSFQIKTYDRLRDLPDAVVLRPVRDDIGGVGGQVLMSDLRENCHWFIAREDRSASFYVSVVDAPPEPGVAARGPHVDHDFVDPSGPSQRDGTILAPALTFEAARARFDP